MDWIEREIIAPVQLEVWESCERFYHRLILRHILQGVLV